MPSCTHVGSFGCSDLAIYIIRNIQHLSHLERLKIEKVLSHLYHQLQ